MRFSFLLLFWAVWSALSALPWLLPDHSNPWTTFYSEILIAAMMVPVATWALLSNKAAWRLDLLSLTFLALAFVPLIQAWSGLYQLPREAPLVSQYLSGFALMFLVARHGEEISPGQFMDALFGGLLIAATASTGIAMYQWLRLDALGVLVAPLPTLSERPYANVGQPNNLATLLAWGLVGICWFHIRKKLHGGVAALVGAFLLTGSTLTQSRAGLVEAVLIAVVLVLYRRPLGVFRTRQQIGTGLVLLFWFSLTLSALAPVTHALFGDATRPLSGNASNRERLDGLGIAWDALMNKPWTGYGWNQITAAHTAVAERHQTRTTLGHSHNFMLDLLLWNGVLLGTMIVAGLASWFIKAGRHAHRKPEVVVLLMGLGVFLVHAMLELPHVFAFFLLPASAMMGGIAARTVPVDVGKLPRTVVALWLAGHACVLGALFLEYRDLEARLLSARLASARIGTPPARAPAHFFVLDSLWQTFLALNTEPRKGMSDEELASWRRTVTRYPVVPSLLRYAQASSMNDQPADARWALAVICHTNEKRVCEQSTSWLANAASAGNTSDRAP